MGEVLYIIVRAEHVKEAYGGEKSSVATASALRRLGVHPRFITTRADDLVRELDEAGLDWEVVPVGDPFTGFRGAPLAGRLRRLLAVVRLNAAVYRASRRGRASIVHTMASPGFLGGFLGGLAAGAKVIYHVRTASSNLRTRGLEELAVLLAHRTITVSESLRDQLAGTGHRLLRPLLRRRIRTIYNGFDFAEVDAACARETRAEARAVTGPAPDRVSALLVGGVFVDKGQLAFIERVLPRLVELAPRVHVTMLGGVKDRAYADACVAAIARAGLADHVTFAGHRPRAEVYRFYRGADFLILPSEREGLPRVAVEAHAFGLPVVGTATVGTVEAVRDGETGFLVPLDRLEELAPAAARLANEPDLRERMGRAGAAHVRASFGIDKNVAEILALYQGLTGDTDGKA
jgi:glycosyltransferase involved in cell wall biosynthesis